MLPILNRTKRAGLQISAKKLICCHFEGFRILFSSCKSLSITCCAFSVRSVHCHLTCNVTHLQGYSSFLEFDIHLLVIKPLNPTFAVLKKKSKWQITKQQRKMHARQKSAAKEINIMEKQPVMLFVTRETKRQKRSLIKCPLTVAMIDKLAKKGIIHKNKAANLKSKLAKRINKLSKIIL